MRLLALDQSFRVTGYSIFEDGKLIACDTWTISKTDRLEKRLRSVLNNLDELYERYEFDFIAFEDIQMQMGNVLTYKRLAYVQAMILYWCERHEMEYAILAPSHWRSVIKDRCGVSFGRKRAEQKAAALAFAQKQSGMEMTEDMADSYCLGWAHMADASPQGNAF